MAPIREQQSSPARHWPWLLVAAIATGTLTFLSFPETDATALAWIALAPLRLALARQRVYGLAAFCWGSLAGLVANLGGFFWIVHLLVVFGHLPLPLALLLCLLLCSYQGLVFGLWAWATTFLAHRLRRVRAPLLDALTFTAAELLVPFIFPWYLGCSQYRFLPVAQLAELTGVAGLSFLLALASGTLVQLLLPLLVAAEQRPARRFLARQAAATVMLTLAVLAWGSFRLAQVERRMAAAPHLRVAMVEGDIGIARKARPEHVADNLAVYQQLSTHAARRGAELIVWPESSYDVRWIHKDTRHIPPSSLPLGGWEQLLGAAPATATDHLVLPGRRALPPARQLPAAGQQVSRCDLVAPQRGFATPLLFGAITWEPEPDPPAAGRRWQRRHYNSALLLDEQGRLDGRIYRKNKLLVFGEYIPFGRLFPRLHDWLPEAGSFTAGSEVQTFSHNGIRLGVMICYEAILPRFAARFAEPYPELLVTIVNDAWFGKRGEPWLHLALTVFRSIEQRVALVRSTNTGVSAFVEPTGRIAAHSSVEHAEVLLHDVPLLSDAPVLQGGPIYRRVGDLFSGLVLAVLLVLLVPVLAPAVRELLRRRRRAAEPL